MKTWFLAVIVVAGLIASNSQAGSPRPDSPYLAPELAALMDAVTLHLSFDHATMVPDMAEGREYRPQISGSYDKKSPQPQFAPGLVGQALVLGTGRAIYPAVGNVPFARRGAIALWVQPADWQRPDDRNITFLMTTSASFYLQRQGPMRGPDGQMRRHEAIQYLVRDGSRLANATPAGAWENGQWHLLVANWSWPSFEISVDGGPFEGKSVTEKPDEKWFTSIIVGDGGGPPRGLLDEVLAFRRPLAREEAELIWKRIGRQK